MKLFQKTFAATLLGATALGATVAMPAAADSVTITILGVGDIYEFDEGFAPINAIA